MKKALQRFVAALALGATLAAQAAAPQVGGQAPGWYRMKLGVFEITALSDGSVALPVDTLLGDIDPAAARGALERAYLKSPVETSVNAYLVNTGTRLVLIDTGAAKSFGPTLGKLLANLKASGYQPEQVDEIYVTHMHMDHIGGLVDGDRAVFPNAVVRIDRNDTEHFLSRTRLDAAKGEAKDDFRNAIATLAPYVGTGRLKTFDGDAELVPGIRAVQARGHTPGHTVYAIESEGAKMVVWGDLMHVAAVQFGAPTAVVSFDIDSKAAMPMRQKNYLEAADKGYYVAVAHVSFPGIGRLRPDGRGGYTWVPVNYDASGNGR